jgi:hypothetical protein
MYDASGLHNSINGVGGIKRRNRSEDAEISHWVKDSENGSGETDMGR